MDGGRRDLVCSMAIEEGQAEEELSEGGWVDWRWAWWPTCRCQFLETLSWRERERETKRGRQSSMRRRSPAMTSTHTEA
jgi:hypothetical protein